MRGRTEATGLGVFTSIREALSYKDDMDKIGLTTGVEGKRVVVQGEFLYLIILIIVYFYSFVLIYFLIIRFW